jgi:hypothetical protein
MSDLIILKNLSISRVEYGADKDQLRGRITFVGGAGEVTLNLNEDLSGKVVALCADGIVNAGKAVAEQLMAATLTQTALPTPVNDD